MSFSISNLAIKPGMNTESVKSNFDLSSLAKAVQPEGPARLASQFDNLIACAGSPGDLNIGGASAEAVLERLRELRGRELPEIILGSAPGRDRPINFGVDEDENAPLTIATTDGELNLEDVIREARGALRAGESRIGINQPAKKDSDVVKLQALAAKFDVSIFVHVDGHPNILMKIPPNGDPSFYEGIVDSSAGKRSPCGGSIQILREISMNPRDLFRDQRVIAARN